MLREYIFILNFLKENSDFRYAVKRLENLYLKKSSYLYFKMK